MLGLGLDDGQREVIRGVVKGFVEQRFEGSTVEGISVTEINGNLVMAGIDVSIQGKNRTVTLIARRFYRVDKRPPYWKAEPLTPELARVLAGYSLQHSKASESNDVDVPDERD